MHHINKIKFFIVLFPVLFSLPFFGQNTPVKNQDSSYIEKTLILQMDTISIEGTLLLPRIKGKIPIALIIAGSGPTDRNGNNPVMQNNSLKMLAEGLAKNNIASLRYDKRGIGKSKIKNLKESDLRFENYINDAIKWIEKLKKDSSFGKIIIIGHSEGSLIGMIAAQKSPVDKYISLSGTGKSANQIIRDQLKSQPDYVRAPAIKILEILEKGDTTHSVPQFLYSLFRPEVQPYMISWFKYNPAKEIQKLDIPVLLIQGTTDIQVSTENLDLLKKAKPEADTLLIPGMNHILKEAPIDRMKNIETYYKPDLPLVKGLVQKITKFINS